MDSRKRQHLIDQLSAYLDGELNPAEKREVDAFLAQDAEARALLDELRATSQILQELPRAKASGRVMEGVRARLERQALLGDTDAPIPVAGEKRFRLRWVAAAAVIGLTFLTFYTLNPASHSQRPPITVASADKKPGTNRKISESPSVDRADLKEVAANKEADKKSPAPGDGDEYKIASKGGRAGGEHLDIFGQRRAGDAAKDATLPQQQVPAAPPPAIAMDAMQERVKDLPALAKSADRPEREEAGVAMKVGAPPPVVSQTQPASNAQQDEPVIVLVEVSAPNALAQQKTADVLKNDYWFKASDDEALSDHQLKRSIEAVRSGNQLRGFGGGSMPSPASLAQNNQLNNPLNLAAKGESMHAVTNQLGRPLVLRRAMPDGAIPVTLQQVQSQWPMARVQVMQNRARYNNALVMNNYANVQSAPAGGQLAARFTGGQFQNSNLATNEAMQQQRPFAPSGAVASASNLKQNELYEKFGVESRTRKMLDEGQPARAPASNQSEPGAVGGLADGAVNQTLRKTDENLGQSVSANHAAGSIAPPASAPAAAPAQAGVPSSSPADQQEGVILVYVDVAEGQDAAAGVAASQPSAVPNTQAAPSDEKSAASQPVSGETR